MGSDLWHFIFLIWRFFWFETRHTLTLQYLGILWMGYPLSDKTHRQNYEIFNSIYLTLRLYVHLHVRKLLRHSSIIKTLYIIIPFKLPLGNTFWKTFIYKYPPPSLSLRFNIWDNFKKTSTVGLLWKKCSPKYSIFWLSLYLLMWLLTNSSVLR